MNSRIELNKEKQLEITKEQNREKRKKVILRTLKILFICFIIFVLFFLYVEYYSTKKIVVTENRIIDNSLPESFDGMKVIHISDIHYGKNIDINHINKIVELTNERNPDLVVFTGDLIDESYEISSKEQEELITSLKSISSNLGKYSVSGEEDTEHYNTILNQSDFKLLNNSYELIYNNSTTPFLLIGLDSYINKTQDIDKAYNYFNDENNNKDIFTITLLHEPDVVDSISYKTNIFLAGHSHNQEINIPIFREFNKNEMSEKYYKPFYQLDNSKLYINNGIGTTKYQFRLFNNPSINFYRISKE